jgi:hypothetical protein
VYFGGVEPDQVERVEVERRVRAVQDGPGAELGGGEAWDYDSGQFRVVSAEVSAVDRRALEVHDDNYEEQRRMCSHFLVEVCYVSVWKLERDRDREREIDLL